MLLDAADLSSKFYRTYPSRNAQYTTDRSRRGYFEHLHLYCGLGFDRTKAMCRNMLSAGEESSLFLWSKSELQQLKKVNFRGLAAHDLEERQRHFVGYLCELAYDLAISPSKNVSSSPGFETPLGIFGNVYPEQAEMSALLAV